MATKNPNAGSALEAYAAHHGEVIDLLCELTSLLKDGLGCDPEAIHWGHAGTMAHIADQLRELRETVLSAID